MDLLARLQGLAPPRTGQFFRLDGKSQVEPVELSPTSLVGSMILEIGLDLQIPSLHLQRKQVGASPTPARPHVQKGDHSGFLFPTSVRESHPYRGVSLWEALSVVSHKWSFPTAL